MIKIVDIAWIADKSLDLYCEMVSKKHPEQKSVKCSSKNVFAEVGKIFENVFDMAIQEYCKKYDFVFIIIPCYPIMRMKHVSIITRFICKNSDFLSELGVSSNQFQEFFEKFISLKCKNEYVTKITDKVFVLNGRGVLLSDWKESIREHFGSSLVDDSKDFPFDSNPDFINTMENNMNVFDATGDDIRFRLSEILKTLA